MNISRTGLVIASLPSVLSLGLFYSLAAHMHRSLGSWPASIGERGFPPFLATHAGATVDYFVVLQLSSVFVVPAMIIVCLIVPRWRHWAPYLALYVALFFVCWGLMQLAPEPFLNWWRD